MVNFKNKYVHVKEQWQADWLRDTFRIYGAHYVSVTWEEYECYMWLNASRFRGNDLPYEYTFSFIRSEGLYPHEHEVGILELLSFMKAAGKLGYPDIPITCDESEMDRDDEPMFDDDGYINEEVGYYDSF